MTSENDETRREKGGSPGLFSGPEGRMRKYKWLGLAFVFLFLACGGSIAWFMMKNAAHKLAGGDNSRLVSDSSLYGASAGISKTEGFFASEEELAKADPALKNELLGGPAEQKSGGRGSGTGAQTSGGREAARVPGMDSQAASRVSLQAGAAGSAVSRQLAVRGERSAGPGGVQAPQTTAFNSGGARNAAAGRQAPGSGDKTSAAGSGKVRKTSVMDSLRSAFKATLYGARIASRDAARNWMAKAFDGATDAEYSIEYDEKAKAALDRINPDSIPRFLKDTSLDAEIARSLQMSDVAEPVDDPAGAEEALKGNKDFAQVMFPLLGLFGGGRSGGSTENPYGGGVPPSDSAQGLNNLNLQEYMDTNGYGAECGCTREAPCCCLPPNYYTGNGLIGDFPAVGGTLPV